ncbi:MAG: extracellular solute-binding protein [Clostridia bacterium]|nr:extracellular solute-binding protein [Clostridia bacterium]
MKKLLSLLLCLTLLLPALSSAGLTFSADEVVLRVYNWQEYIDDGTDENGTKVVPSVMEDWATDYYNRTGIRVRVQYDTFETNETMLNTLKTGKAQYDLVCPSDYVIQKMILATENGTDDKIALEQFDYSKMENYTTYVSPYIKQVFEENGFDKYAVGYMWGTVGLIYNPAHVDPEDTRSWSILWNPDYKNRMTIKDSVRDAYIPAVVSVYAEEIAEWNRKLAAGETTLDAFRAAIDEIMNRTDDYTIAEAGKALTSMKSNIYGLEVDSGKSDIVSGKIDINQAWSGDAVYSMDLAEEEDGVILAFTVPEDGGSVWFDGWVMPKGANTELAQDFVNYLCDPAVAARNMEFIGYTSVIAGDDIFELLLDWYGDDEGEYTVDLTYYFEGTVSEDYLTEDGKILVQTAEIGRQFSAQYPEKEVVDRCSIMRDFGDRNDAVLTMWSQFKSNSVSAGLLVIFALIIVFVGAVFLLFTKPKRDSARRYKEWLARKK